MYGFRLRKEVKKLCLFFSLLTPSSSVCKFKNIQVKSITCENPPLSSQSADGPLKSPSTGHGPFIANCHLLATHLSPSPLVHTVLSSSSLELADLAFYLLFLPAEFFLHFFTCPSPFHHSDLSSDVPQFRPSLRPPLLLSAATSHPYLLAHCPIQTSQHRSLSDFILLIYASVI